MTRKKSWRMSQKEQQQILPHCRTCINDCKNMCGDNCENRVESIPTKEYNDEIKIQNRNLHKMCDRWGLKYQILMDMLHDKTIFKYKYHYMLMSELYEKDEFLPYVEEGENG